MSKHIVAMVGLVVMVGLSTVPATAQFGIFKRNQKIEFQALQDPQGRFSLEYPRRDWQLVPGGGTVRAVVFSIAQREGEAVVVVEHDRLNIALQPEEITDLFAQLEADHLKERNESATKMASTVVERNGGRMAVVEFERKGMKVAERVRQYSIPVGLDIYRIICSASLPLFQKHEAVFTHVADSFKSAR